MQSMNFTFSIQIRFYWPGSNDVANGVDCILWRIQKHWIQQKKAVSLEMIQAIYTRLSHELILILCFYGFLCVCVLRRCLFQQYASIKVLALREKHNYTTEKLNQHFMKMRRIPLQSLRKSDWENILCINNTSSPLHIHCFNII